MRNAQMHAQNAKIIPEILRVKKYICANAVIDEDNNAKGEEQGDTSTRV